MREITASVSSRSAGVRVRWIGLGAMDLGMPANDVAKDFGGVGRLRIWNGCSLHTRVRIPGHQEAIGASRGCVGVAGWGGYISKLFGTSSTLTLLPPRERWHIQVVAHS